MSKDIACGQQTIDSSDSNVTDIDSSMLGFIL